MKLAVLIPVKSNSQRLPNKNFLEINGKPLWANAVDHALEVVGPQDIHILADDDGMDRILIHPASKGVHVLAREPELSDPGASTESLISWWLSQSINDYTDIMLIQPCSLPRDPYTGHVLSYYNGASNIVTINPFTMEPDGYVYIISKELFTKERTLCTHKLWVYMPTTGHKPAREPVDIDHAHQFCIAKAIHEGRVIG